MDCDDGPSTQGGVSKIVEMLDQLGIKEDIKQISSWSGYHLEHDNQIYSHYGPSEPVNGFFNTDTRFEDDSQTSAMYYFEKTEVFKEKDLLPMAIDFTFNPSFQASNCLKKDSLEPQTSRGMVYNCYSCEKEASEECMVECEKCRKTFCKECYQIKDYQTMIQTIICTSCELFQ